MKTLLALALFLAVCGLTNICAADVPKKEDVPKNIGLLKNASSAQARATAAEEIGRRGSIRVTDVEAAIDVLLAALKDDKDAIVRKAAAKALGDIAPRPTDTIPALTEAVKSDKSLEVKMTSVEALAKFGPEARSALPTIREFAKEQGDNKKTKQAIAMAIKTISGAKKK